MIAITNFGSGLIAALTCLLYHTTQHTKLQLKVNLSVPLHSVYLSNRNGIVGLYKDSE